MRLREYALHAGAEILSHVVHGDDDADARDLLCWHTRGFPISRRSAVVPRDDSRSLLGSNDSNWRSDWVKERWSCEADDGDSLRATLEIVGSMNAVGPTHTAVPPGQNIREAISGEAVNAGRV